MYMYIHSTREEMCINFLLYYPRVDPVYNGICFDGPKGKKKILMIHLLFLSLSLSYIYIYIYIYFLALSYLSICLSH